ncbi:hypothetical protein Pst134EA_022487 [Puccinia striiformis f. sp. tritici]|uniref:hypothetical protein n=1 Tax=Puccinia striiformis f. sp. tritici TaxID=168172 RepID=UPI002007DCE3|nr:hypothetical protein Pst134EA_022487 [Puccinia striiformis f. sp. tritici]KAH9445533.1 hypothetical protein Pst134EB_023375 [Puccinia striiformis f. sp. tritici]KAH9455000.1 hypothetical protein Pst134EA_022487 [Puccinia striiformis f. sp. tritici]
MEDSQQPPRIGKLGSTGDPILAKQRARNLLHNYYGPEGGSGGNHEPLSPSRSEFPTIHHHQEKLSIDSPYFDVDSYLNQLVGNSSLKSLLSTANELMSEIRDLNCQCCKTQKVLVKALLLNGEGGGWSCKLCPSIYQKQDPPSLAWQVNGSDRGMFKMKMFDAKE